MEINSKKTVIPAIFLLVLILLTGGVVYFYLVKNRWSQEIIPKELNYSHCLGNDEVANYKEKTEMPVIISVKDKEAEKEKFSFQIDNADLKHYHPMELHKCGVYITRKFNYDYNKSKQDPGYREELWRYNYDGIGEPLFLLVEKPKEYISYYSNDFRVDPSEKYIALKRGYFGGDDYALIIKNIETKEDAFVFPIKGMIDKYPDLMSSIRLDDWSGDGRYFWFDTHVGAIRLGFIRIDTLNWKADIFPAPENTMGGDALNFNTGYVTVHPKHVYFGIYEIVQAEKEKRRKEGIGSEIYIKNLITKKRHFVDETDEPLWFFKPKWISETELEYYLPSKEKKVYKIIDP